MHRGELIRQGGLRRGGEHLRCTGRGIHSRIPYDAFVRRAPVKLDSLTSGFSGPLQLKVLQDRVPRPTEFFTAAQNALCRAWWIDHGLLVLQIVMCRAGLGSNTRGRAGLWGAWAHPNVKPGPQRRLRLGSGWVGLEPGLMGTMVSMLDKHGESLVAQVRVRCEGYHCHPFTGDKVSLPIQALDASL